MKQHNLTMSAILALISSLAYADSHPDDDYWEFSLARLMAVGALGGGSGGIGIIDGGDNVFSGETEVTHPDDGWIGKFQQA